MSGEHQGWRRRNGWRHPPAAALVGGLAVALTVAGAPAAYAADLGPLEHSHGAGTASGEAGALEIGTRLALLLGTAAVAGIGLFRGTITGPTRRLTLLAWAAAVLGAGALVVSIAWLSVNVPVAVTQLLVTLAMPVLLRWPTPALCGGLLLTLMLTAETAVGHGGLRFCVDTIFTLGTVAWFGLAAVAFCVPADRRLATSFRPGPLALTISAALVAAGAGHVVLSGLGLDRRLYESAYGGTLLVLVLAPIAVAVLAATGQRRTAAHSGPWRVYRIGALGIAVAFVASGALAAIPRPPELPVPGVPLLGDVELVGGQNSLLLTPQRPGRNLVHLPDSLAGAKVGPEGNLTPVAGRPGTAGSWAEVELPRGRSELTVEFRGERTTVDVDTGGPAAGPAAATGPDGPECAGAALGAVLGGDRTVLHRCPSDALSAADAESLRSTVRFLADRRTPAITVAADGSARSVWARRVLHEAAARERIPITDRAGRDNALLVVSGWRQAAARLDAVKDRQAAQTLYNRGVYLAPWLLNGQLVRTTASSLLPLTFDPREQDALEYALAVSQAFPEETATVSGFHRWMAGRGGSVDGPTQLYAAAQVNVMQMATRAPAEQDPSAAHQHGTYAGQWLPGGTIVPATGTLR